jgi:hypothetical protein
MIFFDFLGIIIYYFLTLNRLSLTYMMMPKKSKKIIINKNIY